VSRTLFLDPRTPDTGVVAEALAALQRGELLVYPTDTLYALGGLADGDVARRVRLAKGREEGKPLPLIVADAAAARSLCASWSEIADVLARRFWPGPLTLVLEASPAVHSEITAGTGTVAMRAPALAAARVLCAGGPLVATSANRSGEPAHDSCAGAVAAVGDAATLALDAGTLPGTPSTIVSLIGPMRLLRAGAISMETLQRALRESGPSLQTEP